MNEDGRLEEKLDYLISELFGHQEQKLVTDEEIQAENEELRSLADIQRKQIEKLTGQNRELLRLNRELQRQIDTLKE